MTHEELQQYIAEEYAAQADHPFPRDEITCVYRHAGNGKWFAIALRIPCRSLGIGREGSTWILNLKCDPLLAGSLRTKPGFRPAWHMNKDHWITVLLDGSVAREEILPLLAMSHALTAPRPRLRKPPQSSERTGDETA